MSTYVDMPADVTNDEEDHCEICGKQLANGEVRFLQPNPYDHLIVPGFNWAVVQRFPPSARLAPARRHNNRSARLPRAEHSLARRDETGLDSVPSDA